MWLVKSLVGDRPSWHKEPIHFLNKMLTIQKVRLLITSRYIAMHELWMRNNKSNVFNFISFLMGAMAVLWSLLGVLKHLLAPPLRCPSIKKIIILHLFLGVPAATVGGTGTPWHTRGYAPAYNAQVCYRLMDHMHHFVHYIWPVQHELSCSHTCISDEDSPSAKPWI